MPEQLAYVLITPHTLVKSRTGGILARLLARTGTDLVATRMFAPSRELITTYADSIISEGDPQDKRIQVLLRDYILKNMAPDPKTGRRRRVMSLLFKGEDAVQKVRDVVGYFSSNRRTGQSIRDTYGDFIADESGQVHYFEPAVLAAPTGQEAENKLKLWARYSDADGGLLENIIEYAPGEQPERTLVLIKPDNFQFPSGRPGNMIDFFSRAGLYIVAIKMHHMSVAQACEFYGPVRPILHGKFNGMMGSKARPILEKALGFPIPVETEKPLGEALGHLFGEDQFQLIVKFMAGRRPDEVHDQSAGNAGSEKCIALVYEGVNAVNKIREVLGPTDPLKAPPGSIRREFGSNIMINAAHASDSAQNAQREIGIVHPEENNFKQVIESFYGKLS